MSGVFTMWNIWIVLSVMFFGAGAAAAAQTKSCDYDDDSGDGGYESLEGSSSSNNGGKGQEVQIASHREKHMCNFNSRYTEDGYVATYEEKSDGKCVRMKLEGEMAPQSRIALPVPPKDLLPISFSHEDFPVMEFHEAGSFAKNIYQDLLECQKKIHHMCLERERHMFSCCANSAIKQVFDVAAEASLLCEKSQESPEVRSIYRDIDEMLRKYCVKSEDGTSYVMKEGSSIGPMDEDTRHLAMMINKAKKHFPKLPKVTIEIFSEQQHDQ